MYDPRGKIEIKDGQNFSKSNKRHHQSENGIESRDGPKILQWIQKFLYQVELAYMYC